MKTLLTAVFAVITGLVMFVATPAIASDLANGGQVFASNCAACHLGGGNAVNPAKTLQKSDLEQYGKDSVEAIVTQVTNGNGAMPAFGGRLTETQIADVAAYVLDQSNQGW